MKKSKLKPLACVAGVILTFAVVLYLNSKREVDNVLYLKSLDDDETGASQAEKNKLERVQYFAGMKMIHLDLKGAPPKVQYFEKIFPLFSNMGADGLLIEYEDMFPYTGILQSISALNSYTIDEVIKINDLADENNLKVIPLIQTFGHLGFVLKLEQYKELREVPNYPQAICPTNNKTFPLLSEMIKQMLEAHPKSTGIHIGCDEVYHMGKCNACFTRLVRNSWTKFQLFLDHVKTIAKDILAIRSDVSVYIWDDMLREIDQEDLVNSKISELVVPVVWKYKKDVYGDLGQELWDKYVTVFKKLWIASAFKGATGSNQYLTDALYHVENHRSWMQIVSDYRQRVDFQGIFITGWQRYDHFAILCELLPVAIPSLAMCLRVLSGHNDSPMSPPTEVANFLNCDHSYALMGPAFGTPKCSYPGSGILEGVINLNKLKEEYSNLLEYSGVKGWMNEFNVMYGFSNPELVEIATKQINSMRMELQQIENYLTYMMDDVYDNYTIHEWMETFLRPLEKEVVEMWKKKEILLAHDVWPIRPINVDNVV